MAYEIIWSSNAEDDFRAIIGYFMDQWADDFADKFGEQVLKTISLIEKHPYIGMETESLSSIRKIAVNQHYTLYYLVVRQEIIICNLYQNSRNKG